MRPRVALLQLPGVNCEAETLRGLESAGLEAEVFRWTRAPGELRDFQAFVLPGGFSYQDRVRAGALAAKDRQVEVVGEEAERGKPVLGICNGAQVLVEAGLVPGGGGVELALARNRMPDRSGYYARWIYVRVEESPCVFLRGLRARDVLPLPVAHAEGRFVGGPGRMASLRRAGQVPLRYVRADGTLAMGFPDEPNGAEESAAAVCNARGNVLALMPHPERALLRRAAARTTEGPWAAAAPGAGERPWDAPGPGLEIFRGLSQYLEQT